MPRKTDSGNYDDVILTQDEIDAVLLVARRKKRHEEIEREYWDKVREDAKPVTLTREQFKSNFMVRAKAELAAFDVDSENATILSFLFRYAVGDESVVEEGYSLKKGLLLTGGVGCGKTTIMRLLTPNQQMSYAIVSCRKVRDEFEIDGSEALIKYSGKVYSNLNKFGQKEIGTCFDDLGTEREARHFGNTKNVMEEIILNRYDKLPHHFTHVTTNLTAAQIEENYGARVRSRLREMFNIISFDKDAKDRRR